MRLTRAGYSHGSNFLIHQSKHEEACDGGSDWGSIRFYAGGFTAIFSGCHDPDQVRRLLALILDGSSRSQAAKAAGFKADGPDGLISRKAPGKVSILSAAQRRALAQQVGAWPIAAEHGVVRWRLIDLAQWVWDEFGLSIISRL